MSDVLTDERDLAPKTYLGDSVYAKFDGYHIVLTTENGYGPSNTIAVEPQVYWALRRYAQQIWGEKT